MRTEDFDVTIRCPAGEAKSEALGTKNIFEHPHGARRDDDCLLVLCFVQNRIAQGPIVIVLGEESPEQGFMVCCRRWWRFKPKLKLTMRFGLFLPIDALHWNGALLEFGFDCI